MRVVSKRRASLVINLGRWGQAGSFPLPETLSKHEPNQPCHINLRKRPVCPRVPAPESPPGSLAAGGHALIAKNAVGWRILASSENIKRVRSPHSGILLWQALTAPQVSMNICASG